MTLGDIIVGAEDVDYYDVDDFRKTLRPTQLEVFDLLKKGYCIRDIAEVTGIPRTAVSERVRNIRLKWGKYSGQVNRK